MNEITYELIGEIIDDILDTVSEYSQHDRSFVRVTEASLISLRSNTGRLLRLRSSMNRAPDSHRVAHLLSDLDRHPFQSPGGPLVMGLIVAAATHHMAPVHDKNSLVSAFTSLDQPATQHLVDHLGDVIHNPGQLNDKTLRRAVDAAIGLNGPQPKCVDRIERCGVAIRRQVDQLRTTELRMSLRDLAGDALARHVAFSGSSIDQICSYSSKSFELMNPELFPNPDDGCLARLSEGG